MNAMSHLSTRVAAVGLTLAVTFAAAGCGQQITGNGNDSDAKFTYWSSWSAGEPQQLVLDGIITDFEAETGVDVDVRWLGRDYVSTVNNANGVGDGPDLYDNSTDHLVDFRGRGGVGDVKQVLDVEIPGEGVSVAEVLPESVIAASSDDEGLAMVPYVTISTGVWFDAAAHPEYVEAPPATFDELVALVSELSDEGKVAFGQDGSVNFYNAYWIYWLLMRHGGPGTLTDLGASAEAWDDPAVLAAATDVQRLVKAKPFQPDYMGTTYPAAQNAWAQGKSRFNLNGSWLAGEVAATAPDGLKPQTFAFPSVPGGSDTVEVGAQGWTINAGTEKGDAAAQFIAFALQEDNQQRYSTDTNSMAARSGIEAPAALAPLAAQIQSADVVHATYDAAPAEHAGWWNDVFLPLSDSLIAGKIDADTFVKQGKSATAEYLASK